MILLIDNYDSFTFNVYQYFCQLGKKVKVVRNDKTTVDKVSRMKLDGIVISPGPGNPSEAGISLDLIKTLGPKITILGICFGHQSIGQAYGGRVVRAPTMMHGKISEIIHNGRGLYHGLRQPLPVTRYHSLIVERESLPSCLKISSETEDGIIMGLKHKRYPVEGVQFHPESYLSQDGIKLLENFCQRLA